MVLYYENKHAYNHDFQTVSLAYINRYPNPYAKHVLSCDTIGQNIDDYGNLHLTRVIVKTGRLPGFMKPLLGSNLNSWIIEKIVVNPSTRRMFTYTSNVDHHKFIRVEEYLRYKQIDANTQVNARVKFSSNLLGFKKRIEEWSHKRFSSNLKNSREGLKFVMDTFKERCAMTPNL